MACGGLGQGQKTYTLLLSSSDQTLSTTTSSTSSPSSYVPVSPGCLTVLLSPALSSNKLSLVLGLVPFPNLLLNRAQCTLSPPPSIRALFFFVLVEPATDLGFVVLARTGGGSEGEEEGEEEGDICEVWIVCFSRSVLVSGHEDLDAVRVEDQAGLMGERALPNQPLRPLTRISASPSL